MQTGALDLRLVRAKAAGDGYALLGVARVIERRSDNQVLLDPLYIAPQTRIDATQQLSAHATLLHGLIHQRARAFAARMGQLSHGVSEMADFLMLQALNRAEPVFRQHAAAPNTHPKELYLACLQLAGDLPPSPAKSRFPSDYPPYRHDDLNATFVPVDRRSAPHAFDRARAQCHPDRPGRPQPRRAHRRLPRSGAGAQRHLRARRQCADAGGAIAHRASRRNPSSGPRRNCATSSTCSCPASSLRSLPTAPRQLPFHAGFHYFELDRGGELWKQLEKNGSLALHVAGDFPALELELWAIRQ